MFWLNNISHTFPLQTTPVLHNITLNIPQGSLTAIMGLNGSGKTTLLKVLSSLILPRQGEVFIAGQNATAYKAKELAQHIAFVPQDFPTDFPFTVNEFVLMSRYAWQTKLFDGQEDQIKIDRVLRELNLWDLKDRLITTLSGGERQRVLLARAFAQETKAILLDEPCNHLDIKNKHELLTWLKREHTRSSKTIIAVMHDFQDVNRHFSDVLLLKHGQLAFWGAKKKALEPERLRAIFETDAVCC
ncbi:MAG: Ferric aerobactin ABC transporter ATPase component [uncultured bacterium]|nr:MAG: Ferric aerobactin ABC transporter ATPase component [uncultured bacterium]HLD44442.1 ABC transporter ATP-binding protein [bacterium]